MKEQLRKEEAEFWEGHSFSDSCGWSVKSPFKRAAEEASAIWSSDEHNYFLPKDEYLRLKNFVRSGGNVPIRKFTAGSVFKLDEFPLGTIVRVSYDYQKKHLIQGLGIKRENLDLYGMVWREAGKANAEDFLVLFKAKKMSENYQGLWDKVFTSDVKIGEIKHYREKVDFGSVHLPSMAMVYEYMSKINCVEVLGFGKGVRTRLPDMAKPIASRSVLLPGRIS